jgi:hypothetical protein
LDQGEDEMRERAEMTDKKPHEAPAYHRTVTSRFAPTEWEKSIMSIAWINCDPVAMNEIEGGYGRLSWPLVDNQEYPAA